MRRILATVVGTLMTLIVAASHVAAAGPDEAGAAGAIVRRPLLAGETRAPGVPLAALEHVRPNDAAVRRLLARGVVASPTFRGLVARLQRSDVVVYIDRQPLALPKHIGAGITFLADGGDYRYVRVSLNTHTADEVLVALLGHELQHALELAAAPEVRSSRALTAFYERTGAARLSDHTFDTREAQATGARVRDELAGATAETIVARGADPFDPGPVLGARAQLMTPTR